MGGVGSGKGSGGFRPGGGRPKGQVQTHPRKFSIPKKYLDECTQEIKQLIEKYKDKCKTSK
jgi:hypothetical protein